MNKTEKRMIFWKKAIHKEVKVEEWILACWVLLSFRAKRWMCFKGFLGKYISRGNFDPKSVWKDFCKSPKIQLASLIMLYFAIWCYWLEYRNLGESDEWWFQLLEFLRRLSNFISSGDAEFLEHFKLEENILFVMHLAFNCPFWRLYLAYDCNTAKLLRFSCVHIYTCLSSFNP